jgi:hypothetical protein
MGDDMKEAYVIMLADTVKSVFIGPADKAELALKAEKERYRRQHGISSGSAEDYHHYLHWHTVLAPIRTTEETA